MGIHRVQNKTLYSGLRPREQPRRLQCSLPQICAFHPDAEPAAVKPERFTREEISIFGKIEILKALRQIGRDESLEKDVLSTMLTDAQVILDRQGVRFEQVEKPERTYLRILPDGRRPGAFLNRFAAKILGRFGLSEIRFDPVFLIENPASAGFTEDRAIALSCLDLRILRSSESIRHELVHAKRSRDLLRGIDHPYAGTILTHGRANDLERSYQRMGTNLDESLANLESIFANAENLSEETLAEAIGKAEVHRQVIEGVAREVAKFTAWITPNLSMTARNSKPNDQTGLPLTAYRLRNNEGVSIDMCFSQNPADGLIWGSLTRPDGIEIQMPLVGVKDSQEVQNIQIFLEQLLAKEERIQDDLETARTYEQIFDAIQKAKSAQARHALLQISHTGGRQHQRLRISA